MNPVIKTVLVVVTIYVVYCGLLFLLQRKVMFPRYLMPPAPQTPEDFDGLERIWLETAAGRIESWYLKPQNQNPGQAAPVVIFAHGNAELIDYGPPEFATLGAWGVGVLLVEYPGYGRSGGSPSEKNITTALLAAYDELVKRKDVDPKRIVLWGRSIGGGGICQLAARRPSAAMILVSTFTSARSFAKRYLVPGILIRDPFDNLSVVKKYDAPLLIFHGRHDEIIAYPHGVALDKAAPNSRMISYACGHNDCPPDPTAYWRDIKTFLVENNIIAAE
jgi:uncharacterized protein